MCLFCAYSAYWLQTSRQWHTCTVEKIYNICFIGKYLSKVMRKHSIHNVLGHSRENFTLNTRQIKTALYKPNSTICRIIRLPRKLILIAWKFVSWQLKKKSIHYANYMHNMHNMFNMKQYAYATNHPVKYYQCYQYAEYYRYALYVNMQNIHPPKILPILPICKKYDQYTPPQFYM